MGPVVYLNGKLVPENEAVISIYDHGFLYGDGLFEGIRCYDRKVFKLKEHIERLFLGAKAIGIEIPMTQEEFIDCVLNVVRTNEVVDGYIRVTISRGIGLGLDPRVCKKPTIAISTSKLSLYPEEMYKNGLHVVTCSTRVPPSQSIEPRIKLTGKYICNIMAKMEANRENAGEGLMLNVEGYIAECTGDNIFIVKNGKIYTPPPYAGILEGITRQTVIELAREGGYDVSEKTMTLYDVYSADECFLTGTAAEVIPVVKVDERIIGNGKPGAITGKLINAFRAYTKREGVPV
ncbi:MAG TPA: branched-chain-amino-acid transaminase [Armatimonadota bacterium]|jgi:branched-chain amino acid aminotransferase|nr:branched-chain-amino-acid transaminase [Armatimonadota bacterium]HPP74360.1 branched-chain-amino-acid transaminase [Armatimonadota bacterium]